MDTPQKKSGVYMIRNNDNGRLYVGSTVNVNQRRRRHFLDLNLAKHRSRFMQRDFNKCGRDVFEFVVLEFVSVRSDLLCVEQSWMDRLKPEYNLARMAGNCLGVKHQSEVVEANRTRNAGFGNGNAKISAETAAEIVLLRSTMTQKQLAEKYGVHRTTIDRVIGRIGATRMARVTSQAGREENRRHAYSVLLPARRKSVVVVDGGRELKFKSMVDAAAYLGVCVATVSEAVRSRSHRCAGRTVRLA